MKTIKEIAEMLHLAEEPEEWMEGLEADSRTGVKTELERWHRKYKKKQLLKELHQEKQAFDDSFKKRNGYLVAGVDEAGRGPLAGPVVCAAVILPDNTQSLLGLDDSKKLSKPERERLACLIKDIAISYSIHIQSADRIDEVNIYEATRESMETAIGALHVNPHIVLADAMALRVDCEAESIVKGDAKSLAIAAASILAKTTRDRIMEDLSVAYPAYRFEKNAGYGTPEHVEAIHLYGPCIHHRKTFEPVKSLLERSGEQ